MTESKPSQAAAVGCPRSIDDVDLFAEGAQERWYDAYPILHREAPVHRLPGEGLTPNTDAFILSRYEDINRVVKDPIRYTPITSLMLEQIAASDTAPEDMDYLNMMMVSMLTLRPTVELWRAHRKELTDPWVGPGAERHREMITQRVDALIDDFPEAGEFDFVQRFARPLPQQVMATVLGFPEADIPQLAVWGEAQVMPFVYGKGHLNRLTEAQLESQFSQLDGFKEYVQEVVKAKRRRPADDMISFLTQVTYSALNRKLTDLEINGIVYAMVLGGLETTQYALEQQAQLICDRPGLFDALKADSSLLRIFIEESLRLRSPTQGLSTRLTSRDEVFGAVKIPKGSVLHLRWAAANIDPSEFESPMDVKLDRKAASRHLAFSAGPRVCPGAGISRLEQHIAWTRLLERLDSIAYGTDNTFQHQPGIMLGTLELKLDIVKTAD
ncbi:MAG: cytochrome P450 [Gammaproteobacteria bacterium]|nr:cytochrome P450 [Gammaproteobacteria bacterium]